MAENRDAWTPGIINLPWDPPSDEDEISVFSLHSLVESFAGSVGAVILPEPEPREGGQEVVTEEKDGEQDRVPRGRYRYCTAGLMVMLLVVATVSVVAVIFTGGNDSPNEEPSSVEVGQTASSREQAFRGIVEDLSGVDLLTEYSPQVKALHWLVWQDPAKLDPTTANERQIQERYILAVFYFGTSGEEWLDSYDFISEKHVCDWKNQDFGMGVTCDQASQTVQAIQIGPNNLKGTLPNEIFLLNGLASFQIVNNKGLVGSIASTIGSLANLQVLNLNKNSLTGVVPDSLLKLPSLTTIWMDGNSFEGEYPPISDDSTLQWWSCNQCGLQGEIPETMQYPSENTLRSHLN